MKTLIRPNILEYRIIVERTKSSDYNTDNKLEHVDHLEQFKDYVYANIGNSQLIKDELAAILN